MKLEGRERLVQYRGGLPTDPEERVEVLELLVVEREKKLLRWKQAEMVRLGTQLIPIHTYTYLSLPPHIPVQARFIEE